MRIAAAAALVVHLVCLAWLGRAERGGPVHMDLVIPGGIPATLYLPGPGSPGGFRFPEPPGPGNGPPAVLLVHGYSSDRVAMSILARRLAGAGYGVLAIDVRGHGTNPRGFAQDPEGANLFEDLSAAADWLRASSWVDGTRLAVMGHSMGAGAALRFAERDVGVDAAIMISGGWALLGPLRPPNALFIYASGDPEHIRGGSERLATRLAGAESGSFRARDAVRAVELPGNDHTTILWSTTAAREIVAWLDASFELEPAAERELSEPRATPVLLAAALLPLTLTGLGLAIGCARSRLAAPRAAELDGARRPRARAARGATARLGGAARRVPRPRRRGRARSAARARRPAALRGRRAARRPPARRGWAVASRGACWPAPPASRCSMRCSRRSRA